jgi:hypothetical protein
MVVIRVVIRAATFLMATALTMIVCQAVLILSGHQWTLRVSHLAVAADKAVDAVVAVAVLVAVVGKAVAAVAAETQMVRAANPILCGPRLATSAAIVCSVNVLRPIRAVAVTLAVAVTEVARATARAVAVAAGAAHVKISRLFFKAILFIFLGLLNGYRTHSLHHQT